MTEAQKRALIDLSPIYSIVDDAGPFDETLFGEKRNLTLEIGFGDGETLLSMAKAAPMTGFVGIDPHRPGAGRTMLQLQREEIDNVRIVVGDAAQLLPRLIASHALTQILILFPDPWPKKRHHKRRLLSAPFLQMLTGKLKTGGTLHIATDWLEYAKEILDTIEAMPTLNNLAGRRKTSTRPAWRPITKYERRGLKLGHPVFDIAVKRA